MRGGAQVRTVISIFSTPRRIRDRLHGRDAAAGDGHAQHHEQRHLRTTYCPRARWRRWRGSGAAIRWCAGCGTTRSGDASSTSSRTPRRGSIRIRRRTQIRWRRGATPTTTPVSWWAPATRADAASNYHYDAAWPHPRRGLLAVPRCAHRVLDARLRGVDRDRGAVPLRRRGPGGAGGLRRRRGVAGAAGVGVGSCFADHEPVRWAGTRDRCGAAGREAGDAQRRHRRPLREPLVHAVRALRCGRQGGAGVDGRRARGATRCRSRRWRRASRACPEERHRDGLLGARNDRARRGKLRGAGDADRACRGWAGRRNRVRGPGGDDDGIHLTICNGGWDRCRRIAVHRPRGLRCRRLATTSLPPRTAARPPRSSCCCRTRRSTTTSSTTRPRYATTASPANGRRGRSRSASRSPTTRSTGSSGWSTSTPRATTMGVPVRGGEHHAAGGAGSAARAAEPACGFRQANPRADVRVRLARQHHPERRRRPRVLRPVHRAGHQRRGGRKTVSATRSV